MAPASPEQRTGKLQAIAAGPLSSSLAAISAASRAIPAGKDFHFYNSFPEFSGAVAAIAAESAALLSSVGSSAHLRLPSPKPDAEPDDSADWIVSVHDEVFELVDASLDEFRAARSERSAAPAAAAMEANGFQLVSGKKKKQGAGKGDGGEREVPKSSVRVASKDPQTRGGRSRVPFHLPYIPRPQDEYGIIVNNINLPFEHVWLQRSEDGCRFIHPMDNFSVEDFVDRSVSNDEPVRPPPIENTPFKLVEDVNGLKELVKKLHDVEEFSVDLEHNQYRSFQGITCLMQISTRTEDYVVDTLKLRVLIGPHLRDIFKDPSKRKVMHGADRDILWLQRDFGIYVCNLFDTGQASRVLQLERNSLEFLLHHFCGVTANKEYQNADWRVRPLLDDMIKYAREDTHYLLYLYDVMRTQLLSQSQSGDDLLLEVYKRSSDLCIQLYEKDLLTDTSYLHIYGLQGMDLNAEQLAVVAGLCAWRDSVARALDESTGYILPNKTLLEIARMMPKSAEKLRWIVKSKHPFIEPNMNAVVNIIRNSIANAAAFKDVYEQLRKSRDKTDLEQSHDVSSHPTSEDILPQTGRIKPYNVSVKPLEQYLKPAELVISAQSSRIAPEPSMHPIQGSDDMEADAYPSIKPTAVVSVQVQKRPSRTFGAMFGNSTSKRKHEQGKMDSKLEQIKSSVTFPFHSFSGVSDTSNPSLVLNDAVSQPAASLDGGIPPQPDGQANISSEAQVGVLATSETTIATDFIALEDAVDAAAKLPESPIVGEPRGEQDVGPIRPNESSLTEISSSSQECCCTPNEVESKELENNVGIKPLDSLVQQKLMGDGDEDTREREEDKKSCDNSLGFHLGDKKNSWRRLSGEGKKDSSQPRRRQAFPASGNRSMTFRQ